MQGRMNAAEAKAMEHTEALRARANSGDPAAQVALAWSLLRGWATRDAIGEVNRLVDSACAKENPDALMLQMTLSVLGFGRAPDTQAAYQALARAAALGDPRAVGQVKALGDERGLDLAPWTAPPHLVQRAPAPRIFTVKSFIPKAVCNWIIESRRSSLQPAYVFNPAGPPSLDPLRSNRVAETHTLEPDLAIQLTRLRIAGTLRQSVLHLEPTHILMYRPGEEYRAHYDAWAPGPESAPFAEQIAAIGQRHVTVLIYLNDGYEGGETSFPRLTVKYKGEAGDALIFWNMSPTGEFEKNALHAGTPVISGEKWIFSQWVREKPLGLSDPVFEWEKVRAASAPENN